MTISSGQSYQTRLVLPYGFNTVAFRQWLHCPDDEHLTHNSHQYNVNALSIIDPKQTHVHER